MDNSNKIILKVEKSKVQEKRFNAYKMEHSGMLSPNDVSFWQGYKVAIDELFGDEPVEDNSFGKNIVSTDNNTLTVNQEDNKIKEINLSEILKGHEGESFYSPLYGNVKLVKTDAEHMPIEVKSVLGGYYHNFTAYGKYMEDDWGGECVLFPSKTQRDWNIWIEEQKRKIPKTWDELCNNGKCTIYHLSEIDKMGWVQGIDNTLIEKSALALLKIHQLIEVGYGGNITKKEWFTNINPKYAIMVSDVKNGFEVSAYYTTTKFIHIAFHTEEQAEEFISYPENIQLLKDYFMV